MNDPFNRICHSVNGGSVKSTSSVLLKFFFSSGFFNVFHECFLAFCKPVFLTITTDTRVGLKIIVKVLMMY